jgi:hypothetical protein
VDVGIGDGDMTGGGLAAIGKATWSGVGVGAVDVGVGDGDGTGSGSGFEPSCPHHGGLGALRLGGYMMGGCEGST